MIDPLVSFVLPCYNRISNLRSALSSILCQTDIHWEAIVVMDGDEHRDEVLNMIKAITSKRDFRVRVLFTDKRYNDWGHTPRELGKQMSTGKYVIMSGDDNYYVPTTVEEIRRKVYESKSENESLGNLCGMVYWDMVHSHYNYDYFKTSPAFNQIDIGAFATRKDLAEQIQLTTDYAADGIFVENFKKTFPDKQITKINKVLYVHN
jgi:glycosyltransferase involved in cell wall biosynthesis